MGEIKRANPVAHHQYGKGWVGIMMPAEDGGFVRHSDHAAAIAEKDAEIERLRELANWLREAWLEIAHRCDQPVSCELIDDCNKLGVSGSIHPLTPPYQKRIKEQDAELDRLRRLEAAARALVSAKDEFASWDEDQQSRDEISHLMHAIAPARQALRAALAEGGSNG